MYDVEALRRELETAEKMNELENQFRAARTAYVEDMEDEDKKAAFKEAKKVFQNARREWKLAEEAAGRRSKATTVVATNGADEEGEE